MELAKLLPPKYLEPPKLLEPTKQTLPPKLLNLGSSWIDDGLAVTMAAEDHAWGGAAKVYVKEENKKRK